MTKGDSTVPIRARLLENGTLKVEQSAVPGLPPARHFTYRIELVGDETVPRVSGSSALLYVGEGNVSRVYSLLGGAHSSRQSLQRFALAWNASRGRLKQPIEVQVVLKRAESKSHAEMFEAIYLANYATAHGELPPGNRVWERWWQERLLRLIVSIGCGEDLAKRSVCYDWPAEEPHATCLDVPKGAQWKMSFIWAWPADWGRSCGDVNGKLLLFGRGTETEATTTALRALGKAFAGEKGWRSGWPDIELFLAVAASWLQEPDDVVLTRVTGQRPQRRLPESDQEAVRNVMDTLRFITGSDRR